VKHPKNTPWMALKGLMLAAALGLAVTPSFAQDSAAPADAQAAADAAAAPVDPAALPPPPEGVGEVEVTKEEVENPYGFKAAWTQGDLVSKSTFIILLIMSAATWYIMVVKLVEQQKLFSQSRAASKDFWTSSTLNEGLTKLKAGTPFWYLADRGMSASQHH
jgi:biopolymer transport protein ExbB